MNSIFIFISSILFNLLQIFWAAKSKPRVFTYFLSSGYDLTLLSSCPRLRPPALSRRATVPWVAAFPSAAWGCLPAPELNAELMRESREWIRGREGERPALSGTHRPSPHSPPSISRVTSHRTRPFPQHAFATQQVARNVFRESHQIYLICPSWKRDFNRDSWQSGWHLLSVYSFHSCFSHFAGLQQFGA